jgi:hypothetical protein
LPASPYDTNDSYVMRNAACTAAHWLPRRVARYDVPRAENLMSRAELLLAIDSESGIIALYSDGNDATRARYRLLRVAEIPEILQLDASRSVASRDSGWLTSWTAAMEALGKYPWPHLECRMVHPAIAAAVWDALHTYVERTGSSPIPSLWGRWRRACAQT